MSTLSPDQIETVVTKLSDKGLLDKFEIPDELLEQAGIDPKKMAPKQLAAMFAKLKEKGLLNDKPADKKSTGKESDTKEPGDAEGSRPGLVKKKVTVRRNGKTSEEYRWVKAGEDEPAEKPKKGEEDTGEVTGEVPGKSAEPEKPKGPVIQGLNKPEGEIEESEEMKGKPEKFGSEDKPLQSLKDLNTKNMDTTDFIKSKGWNTKDSFFFTRNISDNVKLHMDNDKIVAISDFVIDKEDNNLLIGSMEVNADNRRQGRGIDAMKDILKYAIENGVDAVKLESLDDNSDKFYDAIGMKKISGRKSIQDRPEMSKYKGDQAWMKRFVESI